ncbi:HD domain-containing protein [Salinibacterium sp. SYSU T00001]|uniref:HD domain-containing protein n=1 Tax=Homoserinimonas sedimenticola TaxID=2986805 RepID=UPI0022356FFB|nr:HD domain-containing protein [Salinibacterium sedimenticola]MCW4384200.1 HD domain-containing protein [Salinibacterium sedimenticola]
MPDRPARSEKEWGAALREITRRDGTPSGALREQGIVEAIPELAALAETPQDPGWHPEGDVLVHSLWAADLAAEHSDAHQLDPDHRELLVLAALLHDVGKPDTTARRKDGRLTSYGHAERGAEIVQSLGPRLGLPAELARPIAAIAGEHMAHVSAHGNPTRKAVRRLVIRLEREGATLDDWAVVVRCDGEARGTAARPDASEPWRRAAEQL